MIPAYPLTWPAGWPRTYAPFRTSARFRSKRESRVQQPITITEGIERVRAELRLMGVHDDDLVISSNLQLRLDGWPRGSQADPEDPGVAVYWGRPGGTKVMAIDIYDRAADNLAAVAATLDAMRAIERHGGAQILERAFTGFTALPAPTSHAPWWQVLEVDQNASNDDVRAAYKRAASRVHPDKLGGNEDLAADVNVAYDQFKTERGL